LGVLAQGWNIFSEYGLSLNFFEHFDLQLNFFIAFWPMVETFFNNLA
jgi:hypothetical protein